jgi:hypothetical protein
MTFEEVKKFYGNGYRFYKLTGMAQNNFVNWKKTGFIPIKTQFKIQSLSNGQLTANIEHTKEEEKK